MIRLLVVTMLLHHIEGVCKPWSAAKLAIKEIMQRIVTRGVTGVSAADAVRAEQARLASIERAELSAGQRQADREAATERLQQALARLRVAETLRPAQRLTERPSGRQAEIRCGRP